MSHSLFTDWRDTIWQGIVIHARDSNKRLLVLLRGKSVAIETLTADAAGASMVLRVANKSTCERLETLAPDLYAACVSVGVTRYGIAYDDGAGEDVVVWSDTTSERWPLNAVIHRSPEYQLYKYDGFRFRSQGEVAVYDALRSIGHCMVFPNATGYLTQHGVRREIDLLVVRYGVAGILEINGKSTHLRATDDHARARLFREYGIRVVEYFDATECLRFPSRVARTFIAAMDKEVGR